MHRRKSLLVGVLGVAAIMLAAFYFVSPFDVQKSTSITQPLKTANAKDLCVGMTITVSVTDQTTGQSLGSFYSNDYGQSYNVSIPYGHVVNYTFEAGGTPSFTSGRYYSTADGYVHSEHTWSPDATPGMSNSWTAPAIYYDGSANFQVNQNACSQTNPPPEQVGELSAIVYLNITVQPPAGSSTLDLYCAPYNGGPQSTSCNVNSGDTGHVYWTTSNMDECFYTGPPGSDEYSGASSSRSTGPLYSSDTVSMSCNGTYGTVTKSVSFTVSAPAPTVDLKCRLGSFNMDSCDNVVNGTNQRLRWTTTDIPYDGTPCDLYQDGSYIGSYSYFGNSVSVGYVYNPPGTYNYTIYCTGPGGTASDSVTVTVAPVPATPTLNFYAADTSLYVGETPTFYWQTTDTYSGDNCYAYGTWSGYKASTPNTTHSGQPHGAYGTPGIFDYYLYCAGDGGYTNTGYIQVTVTEAPYYTPSCSPYNYSVVAGSNATFNFTKNSYNGHSASVYVTGQPTVSSSYPNYFNFSYSPNSYLSNSATTSVPSYASAGDYYLTFYFSDGTTTQSCAVTITVVQPSGSIICNGSINNCPSQITYGGSAQIEWDTENAGTCNVTSSPSSTTWYGAAGSQSTGALYADTTYYLSCTGLSTRSVFVDVGPPPAVTVSLSLSSSSIVVGQSATLYWTPTNSYSGEYCQASGTWSKTVGSNSGQAYSQSTGAMNTVGNYTYYIQCQGAAGWSNTASVTLAVTDFSVSCNQSVINLNPGGSNSVNLTSSGQNGFNSTITLGHTMSPSAAVPLSLSYSSSQSTGGTTSITITAPSNATEGTYSIVFSGASSGQTRYCSSISVAVYARPTVSLSINHSTVIIGQYPTLTYSATNTYTSGTPCSSVGNGGSVNMAGYPGQTYTWNTANDGAQSPYELGSYNYRLACSGPGGIGYSSYVNLMVVDYSMNCYSGYSTITAGSSTSFNVSAQSSYFPLTAYYGTPTVSGGGAVKPTVGTLSPTSWTNGGASSTSVVTTNSSTSPGTYTITYDASVYHPLGTVTRSCSTTLVVNPPVGVSISVSPTPIYVGQSATISWTPTSTYSGTYCSASGSWSGSKGSNSGQTYTESTGVMYSAGYYTYYISCQGATGWASSSVTLTVQDYYIACSTASDSLNPGGTTSLNLSSYGYYGYNSSISLSYSTAQSYSVPPTLYFSPSSTQSTGGTTTAVISAPSNVSAGTYNYTFTGTSNGLQRSCYYTLTVNPPSSVSISVTPSPILVGQSATIAWSPTGTTSGSNCYASGSWSGYKTSNDAGYYTESTGTMSTAGTYVYYIQCYGPSGWSSVASASLVVQDFALSCTPASTSVNGGSSTAFAIDVTRNGYTGTVSYGTAAISPSSGTPPTIGAVSPSTSTFGSGTSTSTISTTISTTAVPYTITYTGSATNSAGTVSRSCNVSLGVNSTPATVSISVSPSTIMAGQSSTISWTPTNTSSGTNCTASNAWSGAKNSTENVTHTQSTGTMSTGGTYTYAITCSGPGGNSAVMSASLIVQDYSLSCLPASTAITAGSSTAFTVSVNNVSGFTGSVSYSSPSVSPSSGTPPVVGSLSPASGAPGGGSSTSLITTTTSTTATAYTITYTGSYTNAIGTVSRSCNVSLTVNSPTPTGSITCNGFANSCSIDYNTAATISWSSLNATSCSVTSVPADATWTATSGSQSSGALTSNRTYTLSCTGPGGTMSPSQTVNVVVGSSFSLSCNPVSATVNAGSSSSFTISNTALNGFSGSVVISSSMNPSSGTPPTISYIPSNTQAAGGSTTAVVSTTATTTPATYSITFTGTSGALSASCPVAVEFVVNAVPPTPPGSLTVTNTGSCATIDLAWVKGSGSNPTGYRVYRRTQGTGTWTDSWTQVGSDIAYNDTDYTSDEVNYTMTDVAPLLPDGSNYYSVVSYNISGLESAKIEPAITPIVPEDCSPVLVLSDKDIISVNGRIVQNWPDSPCSGESETVNLPNNAIFAPGDVITFKINVCNSGNSSLENITIQDEMLNLTGPEIVSVSPGGCAVVSTMGSSTVEFVLSTITAPADGTIANSCSVTMTAVVATPSTAGANVKWFQNIADIAGSYDGQPFSAHIYTPPQPYSLSGNDPTRNETSPQ